MAIGLPAIGIVPASSTVAATSTRLMFQFTLGGLRARESRRVGLRIDGGQEEQQCADTSEQAQGVEQEVAQVVRHVFTEPCCRLGGSAGSARARRTGDRR